MPAAAARRSCAAARPWPSLRAQHAQSTLLLPLPLPCFDLIWSAQAAIVSVHEVQQGPIHASDLPPAAPVEHGGAARACCCEAHAIQDPAPGVQEQTELLLGKANFGCGVAPSWAASLAARPSSQAAASLPPAGGIQSGSAQGAGRAGRHAWVGEGMRAEAEVQQGGRRISTHCSASPLLRPACPAAGQVQSQLAPPSRRPHRQRRHLLLRPAWRPGRPARQRHPCRRWEESSRGLRRGGQGRTQDGRLVAVGQCSRAAIQQPDSRPTQRRRCPAGLGAAGAGAGIRAAQGGGQGRQSTPVAARSAVCRVVAFASPATSTPADLAVGQHCPPGVVPPRRRSDSAKCSALSAALKRSAGVGSAERGRAGAQSGRCRRVQAGLADAPWPLPGSGPQSAQPGRCLIPLELVARAGVLPHTIIRPSSAPAGLPTWGGARQTACLVMIKQLAVHRPATAGQCWFCMAGSQAQA